jgi:phage antirepressor YoqD-like protein
VPRKATSKRGREPWLEMHQSLICKYIETTIGEVTKLFPKKIHATNLNGFLAENRVIFYSPIKLIRLLFNNRQLGLFKMFSHSKRRRDA